MPNGSRKIKSLVHKIRLDGRRGKGMAESFSREKWRHAPQKEGRWEILCDLPPVWPRLVRPTNLMSRMNGKKTHTHTHTHTQNSVCVCVVCCHPIYSGRQVCWRTSRGQTGGRSHRVSPPSFCGARLNFFARLKDSDVPFPRRPWSRILFTTR